MPALSSSLAVCQHSKSNKKLQYLQHLSPLWGPALILHKHCAASCMSRRLADPHRISHVVQDAPYLLEAAAQGFAGEEGQVQLSAAMKLYFQRPPECQQLLGGTLAAAAAEASPDVHDRALLYYRSHTASLCCAQQKHLSVSLCFPTVACIGACNIWSQVCC